MQRYFISGVATVKAFCRDSSGNLDHYFDAKTLTDSSINISLSGEEVRGGAGSMLLGKYYHTSGFKVTLTDVIFNMKYIAASIGSDVSYGSTYRINAENIDDTGYELYLVSDEDAKNYEVYQLSDTEEVFGVKSQNAYIEDKDSSIVVGDECKYTLEPVNGRQVVVNANYQPKELVLYLKAKLFSGSCNKVSQMTYVGDVTIEIPRYMPDGNVDLSLAATSAANITIEGSALANGCGCGDKKWYSRITEFINNSSSKYKGYNKLVVANKAEFGIGVTPIVFAFGDNVQPKRMTVGEYIIEGTAVNEKGKIVRLGTLEISTSLFQADKIKMVLK